MYFILGLGFVVLLFKFPVIASLGIVFLCLAWLLFIVMDVVQDIIPKRKVDAATPNVATANIRLNFDPKRLP